ncbi:MAG: hypothetical protein LBC17_01320, partial [Lactobacillaceae bacterium]|nr:hypothetical protein [Lactobacillaceae bacterium]
IDIIEPIEKLETNLKHTDNNLELIGKSLISNINFSELMNENCNFIKGANEKIIENGNTVFLNISAANGKPNKYIKNNPNISIGDITLSLDATTGLVNKALNGFNGYLYKIESKKYQNYEIYYSLLKKENQNIIKMNETGTTIKHSPNSKKQLLVYDFKNKDQLKSFFELSIKIEIYLLSISNLKNKLINLLIK